MLYFLDEIFLLILKEIPDLKLYIIGSRPPKKLQQRASENVIITGFVDDVRPYVARASVYVVPLRMGGGTRLKVLEAMAMKKPIVTTSIGCEGIDVRHDESVLIADDPMTFARQVIELLRSQALRQRLVRNGYDVARTCYDWNTIGNRVEEAYATLRQQSKSSTQARNKELSLDLSTSVSLK
jgi:glycosyltransferase involved in cell wall biosynthesis